MEADIKKRGEVDLKNSLDCDIEQHDMLRAKHSALQGIKDRYYPKCDLWEDVGARLQDEFQLMNKSRYEPISYRSKARLLQCECELIERAILKTCNPTSTEVAMELLTEFWRSNVNCSPPAPPGYKQWLALHQSTNYHLPARFSDGSIPNITYRCPREPCYHYIFGFPKAEELQTHLIIYHSASFSEPRRAMEAEPASQAQGSTASPENAPKAGLDENLIFYEFNEGEPKKRKACGQSSRNKTKRSEKVVNRLLFKCTRVTDPCLRCRLLKKQCDEHNPCKQCPRQDCGVKSDYWKVLGCYRRPLKNIVDVLLSEPYRLSFGPVDDEEWPSFDFKRFWFVWLNHNLSVMSSGQSHLSVFSWDERVTVLYEKWCLASISQDFPVLDSYRSWTSVTIYQLQAANEEITAAPSVLSAYDLLHSVYVLRTLKDEIHIISLAFLLLYYKRNQCMPEYCSAFLEIEQTIPYLSRLLESSLELTFDDRCARRKGLSSSLWVHTFVKLCMFSILKSILIDAHSNFGICEDETTANIAASIDSAYKALVSMFAWASSSDMLLDEALSVDPVEPPFDADQQACAFQGVYRAVQRDKWKERGIKSSKDFLMGLGSGFYTDGTYKGFYVQKYGLETRAKCA